jgi:LPS-assembly lipoprotein
MRQATRRAMLVCSVGPLMVACGFAPRQSQSLPMRSLALVGFHANSALRPALQRELERAGVDMRANPAQADAVLDAITDQRERAVAASTAAGQVREVTLRVRLRFRVATPAGRLLLAPSDLLLTRDMSYNESAALSKEQEELTLFRAMEDDIVAQVLRRLASVQLG